MVPNREVVLKIRDPGTGWNRFIADSPRAHSSRRASLPSAGTPHRDSRARVRSRAPRERFFHTLRCTCQRSGGSSGTKHSLPDSAREERKLRAIRNFLGWYQWAELLLPCLGSIAASCCNCAPQCRAGKRRRPEPQESLQRPQGAAKSFRTMAAKSASRGHGSSPLLRAGHERRSRRAAEVQPLRMPGLTRGSLRGRPTTRGRCHTPEDELLPPERARLPSIPVDDHGNRCTAWLAYPYPSPAASLFPASRCS